MSSVLKALKKLEEKETPGPEEGGSAPSFNAREIIKKNTGRKNNLPVIFMTAICTFIAVITVCLHFNIITNPFINEAGDHADDPGRKDLSSLIPMPESTPIRQQEKSIWINRHDNNSDDLAITQRKQQDPKPQKPFQQNISRPGVLTADPPEPENPISTENDIPILKSFDLKLQAISWKEAPAKRVAVINNKIVVEGGNIEDIYISKIEKKYVVIQQNGKTARIVFGN